MKTFKKVLALLLVAALAAGIAIIGTVAYLTHEDEDINVFTIGNIKVELVELQRNEAGTDLETFKDGKPLMPLVGSAQGQKDQFGQPVAANYVDKIVYARNISKAPAYMRIRIAIPVWGTGSNASSNYLHWNIPGDAAWETMKKAIDEDFSGSEYVIDSNETTPITIDGQGYYTYTFTFKKPIEPGFATSVVMCGLYLDSNVDYDHKTGLYEYGTTTFEIPNNTVHVPVIVEAIQAEGFANATDAFAAAKFDENNPWGTTLYNVTAKELNDALANSENTTLDGDVATTSTITMPAGTFDGDGNTIYGKTNPATGVNPIFSVSAGNVTNLNVIADAGTDYIKAPRALYVPKMTADINVSDSYFKALYAMNINTANSNYGFYANNCTFDGWVSISKIKEAVFTNCTFEGSYVSDYNPNVGYSLARVRPYCNATFTGCIFQEDVVLDTGAEGLTLTFKDCYVDDANGNLVLLTAENFKELLASEENAIHSTTTIVFNNTSTNP